MENFAGMHHHHHFLENTTGGGGGDSHLPPGFRFHPTDEELITFYLLKKALDSSFTARAIAEVDLNKCEPWELPDKAKMGEKEWYFFSLRDRKYPTGLRTNRATEAGYWKATGKDREIYSSKTCSLVGMKKTLVFYRGRAPKGEKSNWVMHEYRLEGRYAYHYLSRTSKDEWVISRVFQKAGSGSGGGSSCSTKKLHILPNLFFPEAPSSPSSVSLPPLLDSASPYPALTDRESSSYESHTSREHVSCFSTIPSSNNCSSLFGLPADFHLAPPTPSTSRTSSNFNTRGLANFPSLRSLQENLQVTPYLLTAYPLDSSGNGLEIQYGGSGCSSTGNWGSVHDVRKFEGSSAAGVGGRMCMGGTELDSMWS